MSKFSEFFESSCYRLRDRSEVGIVRRSEEHDEMKTPGKLHVKNLIPVSALPLPSYVILRIDHLL